MPRYGPVNDLYCTAESGFGCSLEGGKITSGSTRKRRLPSVSVIVPALNEQAHIARALRSVSAGGGAQVIVVDGGSSDQTVSIAKAAGATTLTAPKGRARQMNAGAAMASGDVLLFLHADCTLAPGSLDRLRLAMSTGRHRVGYFRQAIEGRHPFFRLQELGSNLRARLLSRPYGDQAMFFDRDAFAMLGGFPDVPLMEDLYIARAARRFKPFLVMPDAVTSSARRWERDGIIRRTLRNWSIVFAETCGTPPSELLARYEANGSVKPHRKAPSVGGERE